MNISIGSDHAGFDQKQAMVAYLEQCGHAVVDRGPASADRCDYPDYAALVGADVAQGAADFGVLICGTGIGMAIAANKVRGVRAANAINVEFAQLARQHNNANIVTLSARYVSEEENRAIVDAFFAAEFEGGRHEGRVAKIMALQD